MRTLRTITLGVIVGISYVIGGAYVQAIVLPNPVAFHIIEKSVISRF